MDLQAINRPATRANIADITNLAMSTVDYHVKSMVSNGRLRRVLSGIYEAIPMAREDRAISATVLPDGMYKVEAGDECLDLTPREARMLGSLLSGVNIQFALQAAK